MGLPFSQKWHVYGPLHLVTGNVCEIIQYIHKHAYYVGAVCSPHWVVISNIGFRVPQLTNMGDTEEVTEEVQ